jgi:predicted PolB exonuclease-like 3'-5' exonuclease
MSSADSEPRSSGERPPFLVFDTESVPDGKLLAQVKYPSENLTPEEAIARAQQEARERSRDQSDFLPVTFQVPIAVCVAVVDPDFRLLRLRSLDSPQFRTREIVGDFWRRLAECKAPRPRLVTFNGRGFDLPLMELGAFRYGHAAKDYFLNCRDRYKGLGHLDLCDWLANYGACRITGGLNLLSKLLGKPGKMEVSGDQVYQMYMAGKIQEINDYCMFDTLDTYFVFLRTRVLTGELSLEGERDLVAQARAWAIGQAETMPALSRYLDNWGTWEPWP